ncbi:MAG TPA: DUF5362 family protein [Thermoanaerobaculia bacterium]|nr:DUF5362 family protein [Thermoanaerobaculia bacterium]
MRNPYAPPGSRLDGPAVASGGSDGVSSLVLEHLKNTKPWVRLLSVLGFIGAGLMLILGVVVIAGGTMVQSMLGDTGVPLAALGVIYLAAAFLYIAPSMYLWRYGKAIGVLLDSPRVRNLEEALGHQKSFWRFAGICAAVILVLYALIFVLAIGATIIGAIVS